MNERCPPQGDNAELSSTASAEHDQLLDNESAAQFLSIAPDTLKRSRWSGTLLGRPTPEFLKLGPKTVRYRKATLRCWRDEFGVFDNTVQAGGQGVRT